MSVVTDPDVRPSGPQTAVGAISAGLDRAVHNPARVVADCGVGLGRWMAGRGERERRRIALERSLVPARGGRALDAMTTPRPARGREPHFCGVTTPGVEDPASIVGSCERGARAT